MLYLLSWVLSLGTTDFSFSVALGSLWKIPDGEFLRKMGALYGPDVWVDGQWWRILSLGFLHGSLVHLAFNLVTLFSLTPWIAELERPGLFLGLLIVSIVWSGLASLFWADSGLVVGVSGGIFGLAGGLIVARQFGHTEIRNRLADLPIGQLALGLGVILFLGSLLEHIPGFPKLANAGHWGGLVGGCFVILAIIGSTRTLRFAAHVGLLVGSVLLLFGAQNPYSTDRYLEILAFHHFEEGDFSKAERSFRALLELRGDDATVQNALAYLLLESGGDLIEAELLIEAAIAELPDHPDLLDTFGWLRCQQGDTERGVEMLERALQRSDSADEEILSHLENCALAYRRSENTSL